MSLRGFEFDDRCASHRGAIFARAAASASLARNEFHGNWLQALTSAARGGAVYLAATGGGLSAGGSAYFVDSDATSSASVLGVNETIAANQVFPAVRADGPIELVLRNTILRDSPGGNDHLADDSAMIDAGICFETICIATPSGPCCVERVAPVDDIDGDLRPWGDECDIGADEARVPEPGACLLGGSALAALAGLVRFRPARAA